MSRTAQHLDWSADVDQPALDDPQATARERRAFIERAVADAGADGVVVALTGDVDSAVVAALAAEALGRESVRGLLPTTAGDADRADPKADAFGDDAPGRRAATELGISARQLDVAPYVEALARTFSDDATALVGDRPGTGAASPAKDGDAADADDRAPAVRRAVALCLGELAAAVEASAASRLVLGPGTRTSLVGAAPVRASDPGADLLPLGDLYLSEVRELGRHLGVPTPRADGPDADRRWFGPTATPDAALTVETVDAVLWKLLDDGAGIEQTAEALDIAPALVGRIAVRYARRVRRSEASASRATGEPRETDGGGD
ncbi:MULTISPECIES: hypothetical protein [Halorussus]|uniref:hypothetical protein n=1 Tax=Halorussus TaxID=1070314 RepID=UPI000E210C65|nr:MULTISPECIES: hypothetical protein [Halorussus]NHN58598.1 hypothetical protein [Halorussus sp. JP-T4]